MTTSQTSHRPHAKELFPQQPPAQQQEKPAKPPLPNLPQFQTPAANQSTHVTQLEALPPPPVTPAKPVPMTRTQFFGLDNLPSPTADRKSTDSIGSFKLKPDVPQKPLLPKRPAVLGVGMGKNDAKSDDEGAVTPTQATIDNGNGSVRFKTEHFLEKLRQENAETNGTREEATVKENNHNHEQQSTTVEPQQQPPAQQPQATTPISPNSFQTPKRPTVPAPPPPTNRKQSD